MQEFPMRGGRSPMAGNEALVLIISDDAANRSKLEEVLTTAGITNQSSPGGRTGLEKAVASEPALIIVASMMSEMSSSQFCSILQENPETSCIPFILTMETEDVRSSNPLEKPIGTIETIISPLLNTRKLVDRVTLHLKTKDRWKQVSTPVSEPKLQTVRDDFRSYLGFALQRLFLNESQCEVLERGGTQSIYASAESVDIKSAELAANMAEFFRLRYFPYIDPDTIAADVFPVPFCRANMVLAMQDSDGDLIFVLSNPFDLQLQDTIRLLSPTTQPRLGVTHPESILAILHTDENPLGDEVEVVRIGDDEDEEEQHEQDDEDGVPVAGEVLDISDEPSQEEINVSPIKYIADKVLYSAAVEGVSDIHLEPKPDKVVIRYRIDGDMHERYTLKRKTGRVLLSRFKVLGGLDIAERRKPQDGALEARIASGHYKMRLATTSTPNGESMIIRMLSMDATPLSLEQLGMTDQQSAIMREVTRQTAGAIIVVGPTGSGKSTTLYSLISHIDISNRSLMTIEDPVEYIIPNANQQQVNEKAGVTFESLLRSAVRQDPDIVYLGEIRDPFSAKTTMDLASTGHMTFATLHSSNTASSVSRLERLGVSKEDMADSVLMIESQRLLKRLCVHCRKVRPIEKDEADLLAKFTDDIPDRIAIPVGCPRCRNGYKGRQGVYELLQFNPEIISIIRSGASVAAMRMQFKAAGQYLMSDHGIDMVRDQRLSLDDVYRIVLMEELRLTISSKKRSTATSTSSAHMVISDAEPDIVIDVGEDHVISDAAALQDSTASSTSHSTAPTREYPAGDTTAIQESTPFGTRPSKVIPEIQPVVLGSETFSGKTRILVVDDDPDLREYVSFILSNSGGYEVITTGDGVDAIVTLSTEEFSLIISDVDMPNLNGFHLLEVIKNKGIDTPVVFLTGRDAQEDEIKGYELGAVDYIRKPIHKNTLLMRISRLVKS